MCTDVWHASLIKCCAEICQLQYVFKKWWASNVLQMFCPCLSIKDNYEYRDHDYVRVAHPCNVSTAVYNCLLVSLPWRNHYIIEGVSERLDNANTAKG